MKKVALAVIIAVAASTAVHAGNILPPQIEIAPEIIVEEAASSSSSGLIVLLMVAAVIAAAFS